MNHSFTKSVRIYTQPMSTKEIKANLEPNGKYVSGIVMVDLSAIIRNDHEGYLDFLAQKLTGNVCLMDITYKVVGVINEGTLLIEVTGDVSEILRMSDDDEDEADESDKKDGE